MTEKTANRVQKRASVHEKTVQAIARGEVAPTPRAPRKSAQSRSHAVHTHIVVHPEVMAAAKELLQGSYTSLEIIDAETVRVR